MSVSSSDAHERDANRRHPFSHGGDAQDDGHRFAGHVFAEVAEKIGAKRGRPGRGLTERGQRAMPEPGHRHEAQRVKNAGRDEPEGAHAPLMLRQLGKRTAHGPADAEDNQYHNERAKTP